MTKYILQHWHFYQPRRNDYWANIINKECYKPNSQNGILNHVSFNVGPTLMDWFVRNDKETLKRIVEKDKGQALAQPYNHRIMPLIRYDEDIKTQIIWGKKYFEKFFHREPDGMWLPETATSKRVLKEMAKQGIKYTIGAPNQQKGLKGTGRPYKIQLENNLEMIYFFYNEVSSRVSFNDSTKYGARFLENVDIALNSLSKKVNENEILLIASDGETFGHHHKFADLWAEYFPKGVKRRNDVDMLTIKDYLKRFDVKESSDIWNDSAWSCLCGGLRRWKTGCGCSGGHKLYQEPLLIAMENLEDKVHEIFVLKASPSFKNIWDARNDFLDLKLNDISEEEFFGRHLKQNISLEKKKNLKKILEAEYLMQLAFTSCGWFFPDMGIQAVENMFDGYRAGKLIEKSCSINLTNEFLSDLNKAEDWICVDGNRQHVTGKELLKKRIEKSKN